MKLKIAKSSHFLTQILFISKKDSDKYPDFKGEPGEISVRYDNNLTMICCGIGEKETLTSTILRTSSAKAIQKASELKKEELSVILPEISGQERCNNESIIEGILLGSYKFDKYKSEKSHKIETVELVGSIGNSELNKCQTICESVNYARDLTNDNASVITPDRLAKEALELDNSKNCKVTILDDKDLKRLGLNLIYAVGQSSPTPPRLIMIDYKGSKNKKRTALIGKGVTFDSGGQNLKPTGSIETMREDMAGAAVVIAVLKVLVKLKAEVNVTGIIATAHNGIGANAFFPGDIYKSYDGKSIEIHTTDAEGRLLLADAISYCQDKCKPSEIIDIATLTGGILSAFADIVAGLFSNNDTLADKLFQSGEITNERLWRLPIYKEFSDSIKGDLGDLRNISKFKKGYGSSIVGAAFIQEFVKDTPWAHLDIAGTSFNEGAPKGEIPQFATGFGVRLLLDYLMR